MNSLHLSRYVVILATSALLYAACQPATTAAPTAVPATPAVPAAPAATPPAAAPDQVASFPDFIALVKAQGPAVVNISSVRKIRGGVPSILVPGEREDPIHEFLRRFGRGDMRPFEFQSRSLGSGFVIDADGHILTNAHVVANADEVTVGLTDKREFKAKVIGSDEQTDVALLKISASDLPFVKIGDPSRLQVGEWVVAIGAPFGFANSVTQGIVSATGRALPGESIVPFIQTDVAVNPGNSGGPLFNMAGEVVGINSQIYSRSGGSMGISFAIPIDVAINVKNELLQHGSVRRGKLGVAIQDVSQELAESFGLPRVSGVLIASVERGGPAAKAGLRPGDIVLSFNGRNIASSGDLARAVAEAAPGSAAKLEIWRQGASRELSVKVGDANTAMTPATPSRAAPSVPTPDALGLSLRELTRDEQTQLGADGAIHVEAVEGNAAASGVRPGDVILAVNGQRVATIAELRQALGRAGKRVALLLQREREGRIFVPLRLRNE